MTDRKSIEIIGAGGSGDSVEAVIDDQGVTITVDNPSAGDTETGFGYTASIRLGFASAKKFGEWLCQTQTEKQ